MVWTYRFVLFHPAVLVCDTSNTCLRRLTYKYTSTYTCLLPARKQERDTGEWERRIIKEKKDLSIRRDDRPFEKLVARIKRKAGRHRGSGINERQIYIFLAREVMEKSRP